MELIIRRFTADDASDVSRIMFDSFKTFLGEHMKDDSPLPPEHWIKISFAKEGNSETVSFVAELDHKVIGYLQVSADLKYRLGTLCQIGVDPKIYAKGTGTKLFEAAEKFWTERKMRKVWTCTSSNNLRAQFYYLKQGFTPEGIRKDHYFDGIDEISLAKFYRY